MRLHEKIGFIRNLKGLNQEEMAEKLNMSESGYAKIEQGKTKLQNPRLEKIATALGVELKDLMNFDDKTVFITSQDNNFQIIQDSYASSLEKYKFMVEQKDKEITLLKQQIEDLRSMLDFLKK
ncbi:MAG: hypothetical protein RL368_2191 [Pseudomonadota bacterium]|jgi:transcriptional regulator with XRE-family HTH domain